jgi:RNA polymerase sporulation-specific sigma factor
MKSYEWINIQPEKDPYEDTEEQYNPLYRAIDKLPKDQQRIINEFFYKGKLLKKIADDMGISVKTVARKKREALKKIEQLLRKNG